MSVVLWALFTSLAKYCPHYSTVGSQGCPARTYRCPVELMRPGGEFWRATS